MHFCYHFGIREFTLFFLAMTYHSKGGPFGKTEHLTAARSSRSQEEVVTLGAIVHHFKFLDFQGMTGQFLIRSALLSPRRRGARPYDKLISPHGRAR
jgi:hypothetical protein